MCRCLGISRDYFYYQCKTRIEKKVLQYAQKIQSIFNLSYQSYGTQRIGKALSNQGIIVSRRDVAQCVEVVKQDKQKAVYWYTKTGEQGNVIAQKNLANKYESIFVDHQNLP